MAKTSSAQCYHCGLDNPGDADIFARLGEDLKQVCCIGCQAVAELIYQTGMVNYYDIRTEFAPTKELEATSASEALLLELESEIRLDETAQIAELSFLVEGISCSACCWLIENQLKHHTDVDNVVVNYAQHLVQVRWKPGETELKSIIQRVYDLGFTVAPFTASHQAISHEAAQRKLLKQLAVAGIATMQVMMFSLAVYLGADEQNHQLFELGFRFFSALVATPVVLYSALHFFTHAYKQIRHLNLGMDVPVALAIGIAYVYSLAILFRTEYEVYFDSLTMFTFILLLGRYMEHRIRGNAHQQMNQFDHLTPKEANKFVDEQTKAVPLRSIVIGDKILVKPGEVVPLDGRVISGATDVNESILTGESRLCGKDVGDMVLAGTVNVSNSIQLVVTETYQSTQLSLIKQLIAWAAEAKPQVALLAEKVARYFVALVLTIALATLIYWLHHEPTEAIAIMISVLIVSCPCALALATPAALASTMNTLLKHGVLPVKSSALETLAKITDIVFDKTGTLTHERITLEEVVCIEPGCSNNYLAIAAALEQFSEHPIAEAFKSDKTHSLSCQDVKTVTGYGLTGIVEGQRYYLGSKAFLENQIGCQEGRDGGEKCIYLANEQRWLACFKLSETFKPGVFELITQLKQGNIRIHLVSGDSDVYVNKTASLLGIEHVQSEALPNDKLDYVQSLQNQGRCVAMIGDGVNDAPVLAAASVSVAVNSGTQLARGTSDMILMNPDLRRFGFALTMAQKTMQLIKQNLGIALVYNLTMVPMAICGWVSAWQAAIGMSASSLVVVLNALRLAKLKPEETAQ